MAMQRSVERILTTHTSSLPRPPELIAQLFAKEDGTPDPATLESAIRDAVAWVVRQQAEAGVDVLMTAKWARSCIPRTSRIDRAASTARVAWSAWATLSIFLSSASGSSGIWTKPSST